MPVPRARALRLAAASERSLVESSFGRGLTELSDARLKQKIPRARTLRDKYRDLARRQRLEVRGKRRPQRRRPARGNENTVLKATIFDEALARLQAEQDRRSQQAERTTAADGRRSGKGAPGKGARKKGARGKGAGGGSSANDRTTSPPKKRGVNPWAAGASKSSMRGHSSSSRGKRKRGALERSGVGKTQKHSAARTRRSQARRDSR